MRSRFKRCYWIWIQPDIHNDIMSFRAEEPLKQSIFISKYLNIKSQTVVWSVDGRYKKACCLDTSCMFHSVDGCSVCEKWWQGPKWGWWADVPGPSAGPLARESVPGEVDCPGPHLWLPGWVPHHRSVCHYATGMDLSYGICTCLRLYRHSLVNRSVMTALLEMSLCACNMFCGLFAQTTIATSLILSCFALTEEFLCHTIHAAARRPQVSHIQRQHWFTDCPAVSVDNFCVALKWHKIFGTLCCHVIPSSPDLSVDYWLIFTLSPITMLCGWWDALQ